MEDKEWNKFKEWVKNLSNEDFYDEVVECRQVSWGVIEDDNEEYFFSLVNAYAENKAEQQIEKMKCCGNCKYNDEDVCQEYIVQNCPHENSCLCGGNYYWELMEEER